MIAAVWGFGTVLIFGSGAFCDLLEQIFETSLPQLWRCMGCIAAYQPRNVKQRYNGFLFSSCDLKQTLQHVIVACVLSLYSTCSFKTGDWNRSGFKSKLAFSLGFSSWWQSSLPGTSSPAGVQAVCLCMRCLCSPKSPLQSCWPRINYFKYLQCCRWDSCASISVRFPILWQHVGRRQQSWGWAAEMSSLPYCVKIYSVCCRVS